MELRHFKSALGGALLSFSVLSMASTADLLSLTGVIVGTLVVGDCLTSLTR